MFPSPGSIWDAIDILSWVLLALCFETLGVHGQDGDGCGHTLLGAQSGTLSSRNYPGTYPNGTRCEWRVQASRGRLLRLAFGDFNLEPSQDCATAGALTIIPGNGGPALGPLCGDLHPRNKKLMLNSSEVIFRFQSGTHRSGRGFLLSYATDQQRDLISCMERGTHFTSPEFSFLDFWRTAHPNNYKLNTAFPCVLSNAATKFDVDWMNGCRDLVYCPAGCRDVKGDIWGQSSQGYRDTSVVCKAAIHAGVVSDDLGGAVTVSRQKSITLYEASFANGLLSKTGSLSEKKLVFHKDCDTVLPVLSYNSSSSWEEVDSLGRRRLWSPGNRNSKGEFLPWVAERNDMEPWLQLELLERSSITGIVTRGFSSSAARFHTRSYTLLYSKDSRNWKAYKAVLSKERKVFMGNSDSEQEVLNSLIPPVVAKYLLLRPLQWQNRAAAHVQVLGCPLLRPRSPFGAPPPNKAPNESTPSSPVPTKQPDVEKKPAESSSQPVAVVVSVVLVLIVCVGILLAGLCWKRRKKNADKCSLDKGCPSTLVKTLPHSGSELISYPLERGVLDVLTNPPLNDYAEPEQGLKLGSTFRPSADEGYTVPLILNHYDVPGKIPEYAEPLPPEPEYATPFGDVLPDPPAHDIRASQGRATPLSAQYDCPAHKVAPNGYCMPAPQGGDARRSSALYAEPQSTDTLSQHTYCEPL